MTKQNGLGAYLYHNAYEVSNDIQSFSVAAPRTTLDVTGINKSAFERILTYRDGNIGATAFFNADTDRAHKVFSPLPTGDKYVTLAPAGVALGFPMVSMGGKQLNYDGTRAQDGQFTFSVDQNANGEGVEWGLTFGEIVHTVASSTSAIDNAAPSTFGWAAYIHVVAFTGTNCTVTVQQSSDNGVGDAYTSLGAFTAATGITAQRIEGTGAVERYVRLATTGTFTSITFVVNFVRYQAEKS